MEIKVGEYVRTIDGNIYKSLGEQQYLDNTGETLNFIEDIVKHSNNIIDLVEIGDYVNGKRIEEIVNIQGKTCLFYDLELPMEIGLHFYKEQDIKTIVTHEQFESIEYKVETEG